MLEESNPDYAGQVLVITNDSQAARIIRESLANPASESFDVEWLCTLGDCIEWLKSLKVVAAVLDLSLPDSHGIVT